MQDPLIDEVLSGAYGMERLMDRGGMGAVYAHVGGGGLNRQDRPAGQ